MGAISDNPAAATLFEAARSEISSSLPGAKLMRNRIAYSARTR
jgi:hypothetical protein